MPLNWTNRYIYNRRNIDILRNSDVSGVYLIRITETNELVYVGKGDPIGNRLLQHIDFQHEPNRNLIQILGRYNCDYSYVVLTREDERNNLEAEIIRTKGPVCNIQNNPNQVRS